MAASMLLHHATTLQLQYHLCLQYLLSPLHGAKSLHLHTIDHKIWNVLWFCSDAVLLHSLCKTFGLLDSVKQAVELKRSHDGYNRAQNHDFGEITAVQVTSWCPGTFNRCLSRFSVLDEILEEQKKKSRDKSSSCKMKSLKQLRAQCHRISPRSVIQPLSIAGGSPYAKLAISPQLLTTVSTSNGQRHHARGSRRHKDQHNSVLEREMVQMVEPEKIPRLKQEAVGTLREPADRTVKEPHARVAETRQAGSPCDTERVGFGRKKRKSKWEIVWKWRETERMCLRLEGKGVRRLKLF